MPFKISGDLRGLIMSLKKVSIKVVQNHTVEWKSNGKVEGKHNSSILSGAPLV